MWGTWEGAPERRKEKNLPEGSKRKKVSGDESTRYCNGRIGNRTLQQLCKTSPYCAKIWVDSEARRADGQCASKKFVQPYYWGQCPPTQEAQSNLMIWERCCIKCHVDHMLLDVNEEDLKKQTCKCRLLSCIPQTIPEHGWGWRSARPLVVGENRNVTGWDFAKATYQKVEIGHNNILKGLALATNAKRGWFSLPIQPWCALWDTA